MNSSKQCHDRLPSTDISLEEASHRVGLFHIFQDLKEDDLLLIREGKWQICDERLHELGIERDSGCESLTRGSGCMLLLDPDHLECEELSISELTPSSIECLYARREVDIAYILVLEAESFLLPDHVWDIVGYLLKIGLHIHHLLADPRSWDIVHI